MKTSLKKLRGFALQKHEGKDRRDIKPLPKLDELAQASQVRLFFFFFFLFLMFCLVAEKIRARISEDSFCIIP